MPFSAFKYTYLIFLILKTFSSANEIPKRFLQYNDYNDPNNEYSNSKNETNNDSTTASEDPGLYLLAWFFIFFFIGLYMICEMKKYPETSDKTDYVWKFMFFANNGILVASSVNIFTIKNMIIDSSPFALSTIVFIIGCIYYIKKYSETCTMEFAELYFQWDKISELNKMPCFIWSLVGLTDPCCRSDTYTVTVYEDGSTQSNECCVTVWNCSVYVIKRLAVFFTFISFYIFLIFFIIFWLIAKGIFILIVNYRTKNENSNEQNPEVPNEVNIHGNNNINNNVNNNYGLRYDGFINNPNQYSGDQNKIDNDKIIVNTNAQNLNPTYDINNNNNYVLNTENPNDYINNNINNFKNNNDINIINNNNKNMNNNDIHNNQDNAFPKKDEVSEDISKQSSYPENQINHEAYNQNLNEYNEDEQQNKNISDNMDNAPPP